MSVDISDIPLLVGALETAAAAAGWSGARVANLKRLSGGASKESWAFDLSGADGAVTPMVLRRQPAELRFTLTAVESLAEEAALLRTVRSHGVPVPQVHFDLPRGSPAGEGYAMTRIAGETVSTRILKDPALEAARQGMAHQCGRILAQIHAVPLAGIAGLPSRSPAEEVSLLQDRYRATGQDRPVFDFAFLWLSANLPADRRRTLVHGDFRNGNLVVGPEGIRAVLDWELAHIGTPAADLGWLCVTSWRFQHPEMPVGGFGTREQLLESYHAAGGAPVDRAELHAWEVFQTLFWGVMCAEVGCTFLDGVRSVEGAMIARRASETEFDLLRLLLPEEETWNAG